MSEDRTLMIYAQHRVLDIDEDRALPIYLEGRALSVDSEERVLEVWGV